jgi:mono/diheme cytochrome c family protein
MTTLAFVLFWLLVGVGLLFVALSGGPRGARERLYSQSHAGRRLSYVLFAVALLAFGIAIPGAVIAVVKDRNDIPEANVSNLTAQEKRGQELFGQRCRNCHKLEAAAAYARVGPNLDQLRPPAALVKNAIEQGRAQGNGQMAADLVVGDDVDAVAAFVAKAVGQSASDTSASGE